MSEQAESAVGMPSRAGWQVPWTLIVFLMALSLPWIGSRYDTFLGTQIAIYSLFALSLNLLLGTTGLVSFGHAAYFGIGSYACGILMKIVAVPFWLAFPAAGLIAASIALTRRALSSYMAIATCSPGWRRPTVRMMSKLPT